MGAIIWKAKKGESVKYLDKDSFVSLLVFDWPHFQCTKQFHTWIGCLR